MSNGHYFRMRGRTSVVAWIVLAALVLALDVTLIADGGKPASLLELLILGGALVGLTVPIFGFNHYLFRASDPRKKIL